MSRFYVVKSGKSWLSPRGLTARGAFDTAEEAEKWIEENIRPGEHMYIEPVNKIGKRDLKQILEAYTIVQVKGVR